MRQTLARWLGRKSPPSSELPVPALVNFDVDPGSDTGPIERANQGGGPAGGGRGRMGESLQPLLRSLRDRCNGCARDCRPARRRDRAAVVLATRGALEATASRSR
jgi:hypothetical protein